METIENQEQMKNLVVNTILILEHHMTNKSMGNNYKTGEFGMQRSEDDMSKVQVEST